jgi:hypothetical protein
MIDGIWLPVGAVLADVVTATSIQTDAIGACKVSLWLWNKLGWISQRCIDLEERANQHDTANPIVVKTC